MSDSIYVIKPDTFFSNIAQDSIARNNINKELLTNTQQKLKEPSELYNAIENWDTGDSLAKAEWKQWALSDFEGFKEEYKQYRTLLKNLDIDKLYSAKAKPDRVASYGTKNDIGKELFKSLLKAGFSEVLALAILANSYHETMGWNKMNLLNNGPASGLLQMEETARLSYDNFREANNLEENTDALALYIASLFLNGKSIPTTYYDNSGKGEVYTTALALEDWNSGDLNKTVKAFMYSYERPGTPMLDKRLSVALLLNDNKHLFYKEGGSIKRNDIKSTFFAKDGLPGGMLFMYLQPSSTSVLSLSSVLPVEYYDKNIVQSAKALGLTVEEYLKLIEKSNLPGVVYENSGNDGVNYYRSRTAADPRAREAAAVERQRQDQALEQLRLEAGKAANFLFSLGMPSTYVGLATGAMDLATGEGKNNTAGKLWENTRLVLDIAVPISGLSIYKGARQIPRLSKNLYYKLISPRIGLTRTFNNGLNETVAEVLQNAMAPVQINKYGTVKYYGPTMGKTTAVKTNPRLVDFDDIVREEIQQLANKKGISVRELKTKSDIEYALLLENAVYKWQANPANKDKTLLVSNSVLSNKPIFDNTPVIPSKDLFIARQIARGESDPTFAALYYDDLLKRNPLLKIDDRFVSEIESGTRSAKNSEAFKYKWNGNSWIQENNLTLHLQGEDAVRMFKEYGGEAWPEGSSLGEDLLRYVPEARERYGLVGNTNITDEEIALSLYKHVKELGENTAAVNDLGEPQLLFRGDTRPYTELKTHKSAPLHGKDQLLGTLFLGETPMSRGGWGNDRYLLKYVLEDGRIIPVGNNGIEGTSIREVKDIIKQDFIDEFNGEAYFNPEANLGYELFNNSFIGPVYKIPKLYLNNGYTNDLNAFVVRTPKVRNATDEIAVINPLPKEKFRVGDPTITDPLESHYVGVIKDAQSKGEGLIKSDANSPLRDEHDRYTYFALPDFNRRNAKHILPYDLRLPRDWSNPNIYKSLSPVIGGTTLYFYNSKK